MCVVVTGPEAEIQRYSIINLAPAVLLLKQMVSDKQEPHGHSPPPPTVFTNLLLLGLMQPARNDLSIKNDYVYGSSCDTVHLS